MNLNKDDWICLDGSKDNYKLVRFEVRTKGKKPLVLMHPSFEKLLFVTAQYLGVTVSQARHILILSVLNTPEPDLDWYTSALKTIQYLENNFNRQE
ncbi:hypothetical protein [Vibrio harveyi]|uniref:hypothetical protein n=1 Tax=Vibrio harveyi TaxID=669 RepID=UPI003CE818CD